MGSMWLLAPLMVPYLFGTRTTAAASRRRRSARNTSEEETEAQINGCALMKEHFSGTSKLGTLWEYYKLN